VLREGGGSKIAYREVDGTRASIVLAIVLCSRMAVACNI